jgi:hypothetical protein
MGKVAKNLTLDPDVVEKAQEFAARHNQSLSDLVGKLLEGVIREAPAGQRFSPAVARLMGVGKEPRSDSDAPSGISAYHAHLEKKHAR